ncbi:MAG: FRG domain-containing protein [Undibacterium sp.]|nr:FRG domain-containing protein [Opitutaceae bacterium]
MPHRPVSTSSEIIDAALYGRLERKAGFCKVLKNQVRSLSEYLEVLNALFVDPADVFWFRGHDDAKWKLCPSALRYRKSPTRLKAIQSLAEFRRIQEYRLNKAPGPKETFKWLQLAQHYGLPTRLLDWTQSLTTALYFACQDNGADGMVLAINPRDLNRMSLNDSTADVLDPEEHAATIQHYLSLGPETRVGGLPTVAVKPAWNSDRIIMQQGMFTLHGERFALDKEQVPSLIGLPILREFKSQLRHQLERVGTAEMFIFPEPEHACSHLKRRIEMP